MRRKIPKSRRELFVESAIRLLHYDKNEPGTILCDVCRKEMTRGDEHWSPGFVCRCVPCAVRGLKKGDL